MYYICHVKGRSPTRTSYKNPSFLLIHLYIFYNKSYKNYVYASINFGSNY